MYEKKKFLSENEKYFFNILNQIGKDYDLKIQPQINLASIIEKTVKHKYENELFRNIDFGIFDKNYNNLLLVIEINDKTHLRKNRIIRDKKVDKILKEANIKIIKFYTNMKNDKLYVENRILKNLGLII